MFLHLQNQDRWPKFITLGYQRTVTISKSRSRCQTLVSNLQCPPKPQIRSWDKDVLCASKIKIESQNWDHGYIKHQWPYPNQEQDVKPQLGTSSVLQSPKLGLKGHGWALHLKNQGREPKFGIIGYQRIMNIFKSRSRCQTSVRNFQHLPKPKIRT